MKDHPTFLFKNIPEGIKPEDNEAGTVSSLEKLAKYLEGKDASMNMEKV